MIVKVHCTKRFQRNRMSFVLSRMFWVFFFFAPSASEMYAFGPLTFLFLSCLFPTALMRDSFSSQPPDLMARLTGTISLVWGEKCNRNHEATAKVLCLYYEFIIKMCNGHNTVQEILVIHHLCIKTTYERTDSLLVSLKLRSSRTGCENRVHF